MICLNAFSNECKVFKGFWFEIVIYAQVLFHQRNEFLLSVHVY